MRMRQIISRRKPNTYQNRIRVTPAAPVPADCRRRGDETLTVFAFSPLPLRKRREPCHLVSCNFSEVSGTFTCESRNELTNCLGVIGTCYYDFNGNLSNRNSSHFIYNYDDENRPPPPRAPEWGEDRGLRAKSQSPKS